jgi:hypothetical protein
MDALTVGGDSLEASRAPLVQWHPGSFLAVRMVSEVLTLATLGAGVSLLVRNLLEALQVLADDLEDEVDLAVEHVALAHLGQPLMCCSNPRRSSSAWLLRLTIANTVIAKPSFEASSSA